MEEQFEGIGKHFHMISGGAMPTISDEHKRIVKEANEDINDMVAWRRPAIKTAEEAIIGYMALAIGSKPGRSNFFPPTLHSIVHSRLAQTAASTPNVVYKHRLSQSEPKMKFINAAKDNAEDGDGNLRSDSLFLWYLQNFDAELFGVGFRHLTYHLQLRNIHVKDNKGKWKEKQIIAYDDIWDERLSFFHTGVSRDTQPGMFGGTSAYTDKFFRRERFLKRFKDNPYYMNIEAAMDSIKSEFIRVRYYWNLELDLFLMQAMDGDDPNQSEEIGDGMPIRVDHILEYGQEGRENKVIPITSLHGDVNFDMNTSVTPNFTQDGRQHTDLINASRQQTFWTKGAGQLTKGTIALKRAMWRATHDNVKASTVHFLLSQSNGVLNQIKRQELYGIMPMKANEQSFSVQSLLDRNQAMAGIFEYDEAIDNLAAYALGDDWRQSASKLTNEKATVAAIRENIKQVRSSQRQKFNEAGPIKRHYRILLMLIQQYYTEKTELDLMGGEVPEGVSEEDIIRDKDGHPTGVKVPKTITFKEPLSIERDSEGKLKGARVDEVEGDKLIEISPDMVQTQEEPEIYIEPGSTFAQLKAIERALDIEGMQALQPWMQMIYPDDKGVPQPLIPKEGAEYRLAKHAETWDLDVDKLMGKEDGDDDEMPDVPRPYAALAPPEDLGKSDVPLSEPDQAPQNPLAKAVTPVL